MITYTYSYKLDSSGESIGRVKANNVNDALVKISKIKDLDTDSIKALFNIKKVKNDTQNQSRLF
jgi:exosome complex RNA-binding protein Csl4